MTVTVLCCIYLRNSFLRFQTMKLDFLVAIPGGKLVMVSDEAFFVFWFFLVCVSVCVCM